MPKFLILVCVLLGLKNGFASKRYWVSAVSGNWTNTANWSAFSGGTGGASVPGSSDTAIFNGAKVGPCNINITASSAIAGLDIQSTYSGTITCTFLGTGVIQESNQVTLTIGSAPGTGVANFKGGTFIGPLNFLGQIKCNAPVDFSNTFDARGCAFWAISDFTQSGGSYNMGSSLLKCFPMFSATVNFIGGTINPGYGEGRFISPANPNQTLTIKGKNVTFNELSIWGTYLQAETILINNNITANDSVYIGRNPDIKLTITGTGSITSLNDFFINGTKSGTSSGILNINLPVSVGKNLFVGAGSTQNLSGGGTGTFTFNGSGNQFYLRTNSSFQIPNLIINKTGICKLSSNMDISGNLTILNGTFDLGSFNSNRTVSGGIFTCSSAGTLILGGSAGGVGSSNYPMRFSTNNLLGTVIFNSTSVQTIPALSYNHLSLFSSAKNLTGNTTLTGNLTINSGATLESGTNNYSISIKGDWVNNGKFNSSGGTVTFSGSSPQTISGITNTNFNNLLVSNTSGVTLGSNISINGNFTLNTGSKFGSTANVFSITINGNWINSGTFIPGTGTVSFIGKTAQTIGGTSITSFNNLVIANLFFPVTLGNNFNVNSDLTISKGAILGLTSNNYGINIKGNWKNDGSFIGGSGSVTFSGTTMQTITRTLSSEVFPKLIVNQGTGGGIKLASSLEVVNNILLTNGIIESSYGSLLILRDNGTVSGGNSNSFVSGPMKKIGNDSLSFPIGKNSLYKPLFISAPQNISDAFTAEYFNTPQSKGNLVDSSVSKISNCEYYQLDRNSGSSVVYLKLGWNASTCNITNPSDMRIAFWNNNKWTSIGNCSSTGTISQGNISTVNPINNFGTIVLAQRGCSLTVNISGSDSTFSACHGKSLQLNAIPSTLTNISSYLWSNGSNTSSINVSSSGNYSVSVTDLSGCTAGSSSVSVSFKPLPDAEIYLQGPSKYCSGDSIMLSASTGVSFQWSTGENSQVIFAKTNGLYNVTVTGSNGCQGISSDLNLNRFSNPVVNIDVTGLAEFCHGDNILLTASKNYDSYLWKTEGGDPEINFSIDNIPENSLVDLNILDGYLPLINQDGEVVYTTDGNLALDSIGEIIQKATGFKIESSLMVPPEISSFHVDENGLVEVQMNDQGNYFSIGEIRLAIFPNNFGLTPIGPNLFKQSSSSGSQISILPGQGTRDFGWQTGPTSKEKDFVFSGSNSVNDKLNINVEGNGYFILSDPNGGKYYTKDGNFTLNSQRQIIHRSTGFSLEPSITVPINLSYLNINSNGKCTISHDGEAEEIGVINLASFNNTGSLYPIGTFLYSSTSGSGSPLIGHPLTNGFGSIQHNYNVLLSISDTAGCIGKSSISVKENESPLLIAGASSFATIAGSPVQLFASGGNFYSWSSERETMNDSTKYPIVTPDSTTNYSVTVTNSNGCSQKGNIDIAVFPLPIAITPSNDSSAITRDLDYNQRGNFISFSSLSNSEVSLNNFFGNYSRGFGLTEKDAFQKFDEFVDEEDHVHTRYQQYNNGIPVLGAQYILESLNGKVLHGIGKFAQNLNLSFNQTISDTAALDSALKHFSGEIFPWDFDEDIPLPTPQKIVLSIDPDMNDNNYQLAYIINIPINNPPTNYSVYVDAFNGNILEINENNYYSGGKLYNGVNKTKLANSLYNGQVTIPVIEYNPNQNIPNTKGYFLGSSISNGTLNVSQDLNNIVYGVAANGKTVTTYFADLNNDGNYNDITLNANAKQSQNIVLSKKGVSALFGIKSFRNFVLSTSLNSWKGIDKNGLKTIYAGIIAQNSSSYFVPSNGNNYFVFGNSNGKSEVSLDIIGHELTHSLIFNISKYLSQKGSKEVQEGFSNVMGVALRNFMSPSPTYTFGDLQNNITDNLSDPESIQHPDTYMGQYFQKNKNSPSYDPHINASVLGYWYYLIINGGSGTNSLGWNYNVLPLSSNLNTSTQKANKIVFKVLTESLSPSYSNYEDVRDGSLYIASKIYGNASAEYKTVLNAWYAVGMKSTFIKEVVPGTTARYFFSSGGCNNNDPVVWKVTGGKFKLFNNSLVSGPLQLPYNQHVRIVWDCDTISPAAVHHIDAQSVCGFATESVDVILKSSSNEINFENDEIPYYASDIGKFKRLVFNHCIDNYLQCANKTYDRGQLKITFNTGEDYEYGDNIFSTKIKIRVTGWGDMNSTFDPIMTFDKELVINNDVPEVVYLKHISSVDYSKIYSYSVQVLSYDNPTSFVKNTNLNIKYEEFYRTDILPMNPFTEVFTNIVNPNTKRIKFEWGTCENYPDYEFQLLRLFNNNLAKGLGGIPEQITATVDWSKALSIETQSSKKFLTLHVMEGTGYYIWRVRPIGNYYPGGMGDDRNWGKWSYPANQVPDGTVLTEQQLQPGSYLGFFYNQFDEDKNWIYSRSFLEADDTSGFKISEGMSFSTKLLNPRQNQAYFQSENYIMVNQTLQDFTGRTSLVTLPAPVFQSNFGYQEKLVQPAEPGNNNLYSAKDFDKDLYFKQPKKMKGGIADYYSDKNPDLTIPNSDSLPFSRTIFSRDGEGKVMEVGGPGNVHTLKLAGAHTSRTLYGGVADQELVRMFGDEAPADTSVMKMIQVDPNNSAIVSYISKEGKVLASCLSISDTVSKLLDTLSADQNNNTPDVITDYLDNYSPIGNNGLLTSKKTVFTSPVSLTIDYSILPRSIKEDCGSFCTTCDYKVYFSLYNEELPDVSLWSDMITIPGADCGDQTEHKIIPSKSIDLGPGTYIIIKEIFTGVTNNNNGKNYLNAKVADYKNNLNQDYEPFYSELKAFVIKANQLPLDPNAESPLEEFNNYLKSKVDQASPNYNPFNFEYDPVKKAFHLIPLSGCCPINIPEKHCGDKICPSDVNSQIDYEQILLDKVKFDTKEDLNHKTLLDNLNDYNVWCGQCYWSGGPKNAGNITIGDLFPSWLKIEPGDINQLVVNMLNDQYLQNPPFTPYDCDKIYDCWLATVNTLHSTLESYNIQTIVKKMIDLIINNPSQLGPYLKLINTQYNLMDQFLDCTGRQIRGINNDIDQYNVQAYKLIYTLPTYPDYLRDAIAFGACISSTDQISLQQWGQAKAVKFSDDNGNGIGYGKNDTLEWNSYFSCFRGYTFMPKQDPPPDGDKTPEQLGCPTPSLQDFADPQKLANWLNCLGVEQNPPAANTIDNLQGQCEKICNGFELGAYLQVHELCENDKVFSPLYAIQGTQDAINNPQQTILTPPQVQCIATTLHEECLSNCHLTPIYYDHPPFPANTIKQTGTAAEIQNMMKVITMVPKISFPINGNCPEGATLIQGNPLESEAELLVDKLNQELDVFVANLSPGEDPKFEVYQKILDFTPAGEFILSKSLCRTQSLDEWVIVDLAAYDHYFYAIGCKIYFKELYAAGPDHQSESFKLDSVCNWLCGKTNCLDVCLKWDSVPVPGTMSLIPCETTLLNDLWDMINTQKEACVEAKTESYRSKFMTQCLTPKDPNLIPKKLDNFTAKYPLGYHHFTLMYYDRAGNLIRTVPPAGVKLLTGNAISRSNHPDHSFISSYKFNSLGQLVIQDSPDQGTTTFDYDSKGLLRFSQNAKQKSINAYSYIKYDNLYRVVEGGQSTELGNGAFKNKVDDDFPSAFFRSNVTFTDFTNTSGAKCQGYVAGAVFPYSLNQRYLLNRVSHVFSDKDGNLLTPEDQTHTHFSYDAHGNVEWTIQDIPELGRNYLRYKYDLVTGKILKVLYNEGQNDGFFTKYKYDADNRVISVETSTDDVIYDKDASFKYFAHGPMKRMEIGEDKIQGLDYVYTIQGWLKSINNPGLFPAGDPGKDGIAANIKFPKDVYGMMLGYFEGDFNRNGSPFNSSPSNSIYLKGQGGKGASAGSLFNGNITSMISNIAPVGNGLLYEHLTGLSFRFDDLNRLKKAAFYDYDAGSFVPSMDYFSAYSYDANGNITNLSRNAYGQNKAMDDFSYHYYKTSSLSTNRLEYIDDAVSSSAFTVDIDDQDIGNYKYDETGNIIEDNSERTKFEWTPAGKISKAIHGKPTDIDYQVIVFTYDAMGNRVIKSVSNNTGITNTYYVYGSDGKLMSIYEGRKLGSSSTFTFKQSEVPIYGGERIGLFKSNELIGPETPGTQFSIKFIIF